MIRIVEGNSHLTHRLSQQAHAQIQTEDFAEEVLHRAIRAVTGALEGTTTPANAGSDRRAQLIGQPLNAFLPSVLRMWRLGVME